MAFLPHAWNCSRESLAGATRSRFGVKWQNFLRADGTWQGIDMTPRQVSGRFRFADAPYDLECPALATGDFRFDANCRYDIHRKQSITSAAVGVTKRFPGVAAVNGVVEGLTIRYPLAMPNIGADIVIRPHEQKVNFLYEWQALPAGTGLIECPIEFEFDGLPEKVAAGRAIGLTDQLTSAPLTHSANSQRGVTIKPARVWDSLGRSTPVQLRLRRVGNRLVGVKLVPRAFLIRAFADGAAWVRTDTTTTFYPDADAESTCVDGFAYHYEDELTWAQIWGAAGSGSGDNWGSGDCALLQASATTGWVHLARGIFLFDTSGIADTDTVSDAVMSLHGDAGPAMNDLSEWIQLTSSAPASNTAIANSDYANLGGPIGPTFSLGDWNSTGYNALTMYSAADTINKSGVTKLGTRISGDANNIPPSSTPGAVSRVSCYFAEETGSGSDPKLVVTHAAAATGNKSRLILLGIGS